MNLTTTLRWVVAAIVLLWSLIVGVLVLSSRDLLWLAPALVKLVLVVVVILGGAVVLCLLARYASEDWKPNRSPSERLDVDLPERERIAHDTFDGHGRNESRPNAAAPATPRREPLRPVEIFPANETGAAVRTHHDASTTTN